MLLPYSYSKQQQADDTVANSRARDSVVMRLSTECQK